MLFLPILPAQAVDDTPAVTSLSYAIERKGSDIGSHVVSFIRDDADGISIEITARIRVKLAFITLFRLDHQANELWRDGRLIEMTSQTRQNSKNKTVELRALDNHFVIETENDTKIAPLDLVPSSFTMPDFWISSGTRDFSLLDTLSGKLHRSRLHYDSRKTIVLDGQAYDTRYYNVVNLETGDLSHEFWVDDDGYLIKAHILTHKGENLHYRYQTG